MSEDPPGPPTLPPGLGLDQRDSGLEVIEIQAGSGRTVGLFDKVMVLYSLWLTNGTFVEGSRGEPKGHLIDLAGPQNLPAWSEGLQGMSPGGKRRLIIPSDLAYGPKGRPPRIPPYSTLICDVELLGFK